MRFRWPYLIILPLLFLPLLKLLYSHKTDVVEKAFHHQEIQPVPLTSTATLPISNRGPSPWLQQFNGRELQNGLTHLKIATKLRGIPKRLYRNDLGPKLRDEFTYTIYESSVDESKGLFVAINQDNNRTTIIKNRLILKNGDIESMDQIAKEFNLKLEARFKNLNISIYSPKQTISILKLFDQIQAKYNEIQIKIETQESLPILD